MSAASEALTVVTARRLYDGRGANPIEHAAVLIQDGRIRFAGSRSQLPSDVEDNASRVAGETIIPGLIDAHVHTTSIDAIVAYLTRGVTTIRYAGMAPAVVDALRLAIKDHGLPGPRILDCGPMIDGGAPSWPAWSQVAATPTQAARLARDLAGSRRFDGLYAVQKVKPAILQAIVDAAHDYGLPVIGQLWSTDAKTAASMGVDQLDNNSRIFESREWPASRLLRYRSMPERLSNLAHAWTSIDWELTSRVIDAMVQAHVTYCPTFVVWHDGTVARRADAADEVPRDHGDVEARRAWEERRARTQVGWTSDDMAAWTAALEPRIEWVSRFRDRGGRVIVGTDMEFGALAIGDELRFLVKAGFPVAEAIAAATGSSATALGIVEDVGTIEAGKVADLVLLAADPQTEPRAFEQVAVVIVAGERWIGGSPPTS